MDRADLPPEEITHRLDIARSIALQAGEVTLQHFQTRQLSVERKPDDSPVTIADRKAEQLLRREIQAHFPEDAILGEEFEDIEGHSGYRWILDPIDGTKSFICGIPLYSTLIGIEFDGAAVVGVIHLPALREMVYAGSGQSAWHVVGDADPVPAKVSDRQTLADGCFVMSQVDLFSEYGRQDAYHQLEQKAYITRSWGDGYGYLLVATGRIEVMVDPVMHIWDAAAIQPVMEEAGGTFTDWQGNPTFTSGEGIGTNGKVLDEVLAITQNYPNRHSQT